MPHHCFQVLKPLAAVTTLFAHRFPLSLGFRASYSKTRTICRMTPFSAGASKCRAVSRASATENNDSNFAFLAPWRAKLPQRLALLENPF
jgi:hypothetical protein